MRNQIRSGAVLTVKDVPKMTTRGRKSIANWLLQQAKFIEKDGKALASRFTARYLYLALLLLVSIICSAYPVRAEKSVTEEARTLLTIEVKGDVSGRRANQVYEAKKLIAEKYGLEVRLKEINKRLRALDRDADPEVSTQPSN